MSRVKLIFTVNIKLSFDNDLIFRFSYSQSYNIFKTKLTPLNTPDFYPIEQTLMKFGISSILHDFKKMRLVT